MTNPRPAKKRQWLNGQLFYVVHKAQDKRSNDTSEAVKRIEHVHLLFLGES